LSLFDSGRGASDLPAKYSLLFRLFQLPMCKSGTFLLLIPVLIRGSNFRRLKLASISVARTHAGSSSVVHLISGFLSSLTLRFPSQTLSDLCPSQNPVS
jgi:hypothetical protein